MQPILLPDAGEIHGPAETGPVIPGTEQDLHIQLGQFHDGGELQLVFRLPPVQIISGNRIGLI